MSDKYICTKSITPNQVKQKIDEVRNDINSNISTDSKKIIMIAGFTKPWFEFQENLYRINNPNVCNGCYNNKDIIFTKEWDFCPYDLNNPEFQIPKVKNYDKKILIIGCGRSGTTYLSQLFQKIGLDVQHEKCGKHGMISGLATVRNKYGNNTFRYEAIRPDIHFDYILHIVRHPLNTINSMVPHMTSKYLDFFKQFIPIKNDDSSVLMSMKFWYYWNLEAENQAELIFRIENIKQEFSKIFNYINLQQFNDYKEICDTIQSNTNTSQWKTNLTWQDLFKCDKNLSRKIQEKASEYGYTN